jgi:hypothetical protein
VKLNINFLICHLQELNVPLCKERQGTLTFVWMFVNSYSNKLCEMENKLHYGHIFFFELSPVKHGIHDKFDCIFQTKLKVVS